MKHDWFVVELFALIFGAIWALTAIPAVFWDAWTPFIGAGIVFVMVMIITTAITLLDP